MMELSKTFFKLVVLGFLISFSLFLFAQAIIEVSDASDVEKVAVTFTNFLEEERFEDAVELFNTEMAEALPQQTLETVWNGLIDRTGELQEVIGTRIAEENGYDVVYVSCRFTRSSLDIKIVFDGEEKIAGLWFVPAETEGIHGIYGAALIATGISVIPLVGLVFWLSKRRWSFFALALIMFPFSAIVNLLVKKPILDFLLVSLNVSSDLSVTTPWWFLLLILLLSPFTEEAVKLFPLVLKKVRSMIDSSSVLLIGMVLGMGFGIGEIWYLAWQFSMVPMFAAYPFYYFGGFILERIVAVFIHGVMTAVAISGFVKGRKGLLVGYVGAVLLHAFANIGAMFYQIRFWDATLASVYLLLPFVVALFIFVHQFRQLKRQEIS